VSEWKKCEDELPPFDLPVWIHLPGGQIIIGERSNSTDGWLWGNCYGNAYFHDGAWVSNECEIDDDYEPTHWQPLPQPAK
jgi:hypothetical protein